MKKFKYLVSAIKKGSINLEKHCTGSDFCWHGHVLNVTPLFCSYGQIGYSIYEKSVGELNYDYELEKFYTDEE